MSLHISDNKRNKTEGVSRHKKQVLPRLEFYGITVREAATPMSVAKGVNTYGCFHSDFCCAVRQKCFDNFVVFSVHFSFCALRKSEFRI